MTPSPAPEWPVPSSIALGNIYNGAFLVSVVLPVNYVGVSASEIKAVIDMPGNVIYDAFAVTPSIEYMGGVASNASSDPFASPVSYTGPSVVWQVSSAMSSVDGALGFDCGGIRVVVDYSFSQA